MKNTLVEIIIDGNVIFFEATEKYLDSINQLLVFSALTQIQGDLDIEAINNDDVSTLLDT